MAKGKIQMRCVSSVSCAKRLPIIAILPRRELVSASSRCGRRGSGDLQKIEHQHRGYENPGQVNEHDEGGCLRFGVGAENAPQIVTQSNEPEVQKRHFYRCSVQVIGVGGALGDDEEAAGEAGVNHDEDQHEVKEVCACRGSGSSNQRAERTPLCSQRLLIGEKKRLLEMMKFRVNTVDKHSINGDHKPANRPKRHHYI